MRKMLVAVLGILAGLLIVACAGATPAPVQPKTAAEIATYKGSDRQQILEDGARREGKLSMYTSLRQDTLGPVLKEFKARYPYIAVDFWIGSGGEIVEKLRTEREAGRYEVDVVDDSTSPPVLAEMGTVSPFYSPYAEAYELRDGGGRWVAYMMYARALAYNTKLVSRDLVPTTWKGLLDLKWRGKVAWSGVNIAGDMIALWLDTMGQEAGMDFIKALAKSGTMVTLATAPRGVADQTIAGEYPMCLCSVTHVEVSKAAGAPIDYVVPEGPVATTVTMMALVKNAPNPHAAMLWIDFVLDPRGGGEVHRKNHQLPLHPEQMKLVPQLVGRKTVIITAEAEQEGLKLVRELFLK